MAKETVPNRRYTDEFKLEALRLAESVGINQAAKRLEMPSSSLGNWARLKRKGKLAAMARATPLAGSAAELEAENNRLRRELANAKLDLEIVKKAAAYFAKESR
jgi:transposase